MDSTFTQKLIGIQDPAEVLRAMHARRYEILQGIEEGKVLPGSDAMRELVELDFALEGSGLNIESKDGTR